MSFHNDVHSYLADLLGDLSRVDYGLVMVAVFVVCSVIVLDSFSTFLKRRRKEIGIPKGGVTVSVDGSKTLQPRYYYSEMQGLCGKPDALISEGGFIIPVERKPLARKIRDRYVSQLLVYMRLVEEFEGKKPPYGYLILGANARRVKIENSPQRQEWLQHIINEMRAIIAGGPANPTPHPKKCERCDVKHACRFRQTGISTNSSALPIVAGDQ